MSDELKENMALDALQKIKEAEIEARKIIQDAHDVTSAKIIQDANEDVVQIRERVLDEARKQAQEKKKSIIKEANDEVKKIKKETQAEIGRLKERSADSKTDVITKVATNIRSAIEGGKR